MLRTHRTGQDAERPGGALVVKAWAISLQPLQPEGPYSRLGL